MGQEDIIDPVGVGLDLIVEGRRRGFLSVLLV